MPSSSLSAREITAKLFPWGIRECLRGLQLQDDPAVHEHVAPVESELLPLEYHGDWILPVDLQPTLLQFYVNARA